MIKKAQCSHHNAPSSDMRCEQKNIKQLSIYFPNICMFFDLEINFGNLYVACSPTCLVGIYFHLDVFQTCLFCLVESHGPSLATSVFIESQTWFFPAVLMVLCTYAEF